MEKDQLSLHMNDGKGEKSYANNSSLQRTIIRKTRTILEETIMRLLYCDSSPNCMKDPLLGSSEASLLNKGHCYVVNKSPPVVYNSYLKQFQQDFKLFLKSRSEELVPGGAIVLVLLGRNEIPRRNGWELISLILNDMFLEGLIEEEKLDSFNIPVYEPTLEEIRHAIQEEGSFVVLRLEILILPLDEGLNEGGDDSFLAGNIKAELIAKHMRAILEPLLSTKFGAEVINELFIRYEKKTMQLMEVEKLECGNLMISMIKTA
uniref:Jasmonate O-methyltransferase n=1 Tax=Glycine max TaxID=3847 RepID=A0A0R0IDD3_SOYBN